MVKEFLNENAKSLDAKLAPAAAGIICVFVLFLRTHSSFVSPQFWAEDGVVFWQQQATFGWNVIFSPYAGYQLFVPRLVAAISSLADAAYAPILFFYSYVALCFWASFTAAKTVSNPLLGVLFGAGLMLPPLGLGEVLGTITNVQWILAPTLALLLMPATVSINRIAYAIFVSITGPFSVFLAPVAAYRFYKTYDVVSGVILFGAAIQILTMLHSSAPEYPASDGTLQHLVGVLVFRPFFYSAICAVLGVGLFMATLQPRMRNLRLLIIYLAVAVTAGTMYRFAQSPTALDSELNGSRYFYIPRVVAIWCAISVAFIDRRNTALAVAFILSLEFAGFEHLKKTPLPNADWAQHYKDGAATIKISPPGWEVKISKR